jgi:excisionase family DNA binding protein
MTLTEFAERYISVGEVATILGVTVQTVRRMVKADELPAITYAGKYFFEREAVLDFKPTYAPVPHRRNRWRNRRLV